MHVCYSNVAGRPEANLDGFRHLPARLAARLGADGDHVFSIASEALSRRIEPNRAIILPGQGPLDERRDLKGFQHRLHIHRTVELNDERLRWSMYLPFRGGVLAQLWCLRREYRRRRRYRPWRRYGRAGDQNQRGKQEHHDNLDWLQVTHSSPLYVIAVLARHSNTVISMI